MKRRWLIRILFLLPIVLCAAGWAWSGTHVGEIGYTRGAGCAVGTNGGVIGIAFGSIMGGPNGWDGRVSGHSAHYFPPFEWGTFLGFGFEHGRGPEVYIVFMPYALPLFVFSIVLIIVWRMTRVREPARAFPVEFATKDEQP